MDLITLAIPVFFIGIALEVWLGARRGRRVLRVPDAICDLSLGVLQTLVGVVFVGALTVGYQWLFTHHRLHTFRSDSALAWLLLLLGVDFLYYWFHRASHRVALGWAAHAPHHSSEDYNLAVALRQGPLQPFVSRLFYLPLALAGFPLDMFVAMNSINTLYQFWIHTELIGTLGPLEWVLNTPSHHRVHHGTNAKYIDKNHAGIFIVWDRLFGTFAPEQEAPRYGTLSELRSWNPLKAWALPFLDLWRKTVRAPRWVDKLRAWAMPPEWSPPGLAAEGDLTRPPRDEHSPPLPLQRASLALFVLALLVTTLFLFLVAPTASLAGALGWSLGITALLGCCGALLDAGRSGGAGAG